MRVAGGRNNICSSQHEYPTQEGWEQKLPRDVPNHGQHQVALPKRLNICWTSQEPTKVATVAQVAAPREGHGHTQGSEV